MIGRCTIVDRTAPLFRKLDVAFVLSHVKRLLAVELRVGVCLYDHLLHMTQLPYAQLFPCLSSQYT